MSDYIEYILYGIFLVIMLIAAIFKLPDWIKKIKEIGIKGILEILFGLIDELLPFAQYCILLYILKLIWDSRSLLNFIIALIAIIPLAYDLMFLKPSKEKEAEQLKNKLENVESELKKSQNCIKIKEKEIKELKDTINEYEMYFKYNDIEF